MANNKIQLGNGDVLLDLTGDTVRADKLARGYTAHDKSGAQITGTMDPSGGGTDHDFVVTADLDPDTKELSNVSATLAEIAAAAAANKDVRFDAIASIAGVATIVFSAPLTQCQSVNYDGTSYYSISFTTFSRDGFNVTFVNVTATSGDHDGEFVVDSRTVPIETIPIDITLDNSLRISDISHFDIEDILTCAELGYDDRISIAIRDGTAAIELTCTYADMATMSMRFSGEDRGIRYIVNMQIFANEEDVPQDAYKGTGYIDETQVWYAVTIDYLLTGDVINIDATVGGTLPNLTLTVTNADLPALFEKKLLIAMDRKQFHQIHPVVNISGSLSAVFYTQIVAFFNDSNTIAFDSSLDAGAGSSIEVGGSMTLSQTEPTSGYYIHTGIGWLTITCGISMPQ